MRLHSAEFAAGVHRHFAEMQRAHGAAIRVEVAAAVPATLVIGYREALRVLSDSEHFPADSRVWKSLLPNDCPALPMMVWGTAAANMEESARARAAYSAGIESIDLYAVRAAVESAAIPLINSFCETGGADLLAQYARPLTTRVLHQLMGFPMESRDRLPIVPASASSANLNGETFEHTLATLVLSKRRSPGADLTSNLVTHPAGFEDAEIVEQLMKLYMMGAEPTCNLIVNTLLLMSTDGHFHDELLSGTLSVRDAIDKVLFTDPPLMNGCPRFPRQPQIVGDVWVPAHQPVLVSPTACNNDPAVGGDRTGNRSHLAWGAGEHACPARTVATLIVQEALDQLLDALPEIELAIPAGELVWQASPIHRAPVAIPVTFPPSRPLPDPSGAEPR
ncbi:cytochrome P450 [Nocardia sp. NPDC005978]|uniref:cytochrome P450 n=1 Tax=Nocardia sp. NPDC005978 TaxID=3156725 RepID=UPI0033AA0736